MPNVALAVVGATSASLSVLSFVVDGSADIVEPILCSQRGGSRISGLMGGSRSIYVLDSRNRRSKVAFYHLSLISARCTCRSFKLILE